MANWQVISLDTTTPQLRAPGTGDGYSFNSGSTQLGVWTTTGLGIGTASPAYKLDVRGSTDTSYFNITSTADANSTTLRIGTDATAAFINATGSSSGTLQLRTYGTTRATLDSSGNLGLGTSSPNYLMTMYKASLPILQIVNSTSGSGASDGLLMYLNGANATLSNEESGYLGFQTAGTQRAVIDSSGNLGIGTASPAAILSGSNVVVDATATAGAEFIARRSGGGATLITGVTSSNTGYLWMSTNTALLFGTNNTERGRFSAGGDFYVGGTSNSTTPTLNRGVYLQSTTNNHVIGYSLLIDEGSNNRRGSMFLDDANGVFGWDVTASSGVPDYVWRTAGSEKARILSGGDFLVAKTSNDVATVGTIITTDGRVIATTGDADCMVCNRQNSDGALMEFRQANTTEGTISVSGNTVSYNAFAGSHWSQLQDGSKPDILRGTVMESINELCVWPGENNERLPKSKVSDTAGSKKVYGVFMAWDNDWTATNDMYITAVGAFICRINGSVTVEEGDLLESNGDGTARVQADDIIRSSTIGKVTSTVKTHEYDDGSYCVPTVLYCG